MPHKIKFLVDDVIVSIKPTSFYLLASPRSSMLSSSIYFSKINHNAVNFFGKFLVKPNFGTCDHFSGKISNKSSLTSPWITISSGPVTEEPQAKRWAKNLDATFRSIPEESKFIITNHFGHIFRR